MKALPICLTLMLLIGAGRPLHAQDEGLKLLPESPEHDVPFLVYRDEGIASNDECTWFAFHEGKPLAAKEYTANGGWLKVHRGSAGTYTFVLSRKHNNADTQWAKTANLSVPDAPDAPRSPKENGMFDMQSIPEAPALGKPILVYRDTIGDADIKPTWLVFRDNQPLNSTEYTTKGGWLKVHGAAAGRYTFVVSGNGNAPEEGARSLEIRIAKAAPPEPIKPSTIAKVFETRATEVIASRRTSPLSSTSNQTPNAADRLTIQCGAELQTRLPKIQDTLLANELENVARLAMQQNWTTPQIVKETRTAWERSVRSSGGDINGWVSLEGLLKDVAIRFEDSSVEENSSDAILALAALATILRQEAVVVKTPPPVQQRQQVQAVSAIPVSSETICMPTAPCCGRRPFVQRR